MRIFLLLITCVALSVIGLAQLDVVYQEPPEEIRVLADALQPPVVQVNQAGTWMVMLETGSFITLAELAEEEYRLAGLRINPATFGPSRSGYYYGLTMQSTDKKAEPIDVMGLPDNPLIGNTGWSPDNRYFSFTVTTENGIELWVLDMVTAMAKRLTDGVLNDVFFW